MNLSFIKILLVVFPLVFSLSGCTLFAVADAVGSAVVGTATLAVKGTAAVVGAAIPDGDDEEEESEEE